MNYKGLITFVTVVLSGLCCYYLSFTWVDYRVKQKAIAYATDSKGKIDFAKKQAYLGDIWKKPVYQIGGIKYSYEEVKENSLKLGLDLQGGMHVVLEISPKELIKTLAGDSQDPIFIEALEKAQIKHEKQHQVAFSKLFYNAYKELNPEGKLWMIFSTAANRQRIGRDMSDQNILHFIDLEMNEALSRSFNILRVRLDRFGASQPNIQQLVGTNRIQVELPGVTNPERIRKLLQGVAQLKFWEVAVLNECESHLQAVNNLLFIEEQKTSKKNDVLPSDVSDKSTTSDKKANAPAVQLQKDSEKHPTLSVLFKLLQFTQRGGLTYAIEDVPTIQEIFARNDVQKLLPAHVRWLWEVKPSKYEDKEFLTLYPIKEARNGKALLEGNIITDASHTFDIHGQPAVSMQMNNIGARTWQRVTINNIGKQIAITLDDMVYSAPTVQTEIPNGMSQISGNFTIEEAKDLANILKTGSLPAPVKIVEEVVIGPTLGKEAQYQGMISIMMGLGLVLLFMICYYAKGGGIASLALLFNLIFILGTLAQLDAALTLPGIAGIVLTIGMSVDANVLIFERIREELRTGLPMTEALKRGYYKSYSSILDANITTFLTGVILYLCGQGPVRGFATILMIGIISSVFSSIFITRLLFTWWIRRRKEVRFSFASVLKDINVNFIAYRRYFYGFSILFLLVGIGFIMNQRGLNFGVDFTGGRSYVVTFTRPIDAAMLKEKLLSGFCNQGTTVKTYGANNTVKITTAYLMQDGSSVADETVKQALIKGIGTTLGMKYVDNTTPLGEKMFTIVNSTKVGATVAKDVQSSAQYAVILSLIMIFIYITLRFRKWRFGLAAVLALIHDVMAVLASFAIVRGMGYSYEVDEVFIAAILTIIGYSINDSVVVFDRIREKLNLKGYKEVADVANSAINETMSRTLITSLTTFIATLTLFIFGGAALWGFSFSLLVGVLFGTYSSICIATPLVIDLTRKKTK